MVIVVQGFTSINFTAQAQCSYDTVTTLSAGAAAAPVAVGNFVTAITSNLGPMFRVLFTGTGSTIATISIYLTPKSDLESRFNGKSAPSRWILSNRCPDGAVGTSLAAIGAVCPTADSIHRDAPEVTWRWRCAALPELRASTGARAAGRPWAASGPRRDGRRRPVAPHPPVCCSGVQM